MFSGAHIDLNLFSGVPILSKVCFLVPIVTKICFLVPILTKICFLVPILTTTMCIFGRRGSSLLCLHPLQPWEHSAVSAVSPLFGSSLDYFVNRGEAVCENSCVNGRTAVSSSAIVSIQETIEIDIRTHVVSSMT